MNLEDGYHQRQFITDRLKHDYRIPNLEDETMSGLIQTWTIAIANDWGSLAELTRKQIEKRIKSEHDER